MVKGAELGAASLQTKTTFHLLEQAEEQGVVQAGGVEKPPIDLVGHWSNPNVLPNAGPSILVQVGRGWGPAQH